MRKVTLFIFSFLPTAVGFACSVCFGSEEGGMVRGFTWGIALLLALPFLMLGVFITRIVIATRKQRESHE